MNPILYLALNRVSGRLSESQALAALSVMFKDGMITREVLEQSMNHALNANPPVPVELLAQTTTFTANVLAWSCSTPLRKLKHGLASAVMSSDDLRHQPARMILTSALHLALRRNCAGHRDTIALFMLALEALPEDCPDLADQLRDIGTTQLKLAETGHAPVETLVSALTYFHLAKQCCPAGNENYGRTLICEGYAHRTLAIAGHDVLPNFYRAIELQQEARKCFQKNSENYGGAMNNEADVRLRLSQLGLDETLNHLQALTLSLQAQECFESGHNLGVALLNEGAASLALVRDTEDVIGRSDHIFKVFKRAIECLDADSVEHVRAIMNKASTHVVLAERNVDLVQNLEQAIASYNVAREALPPCSHDYLTVAINTAEAHLMLAKNGAHAKVNQRKAKALLKDALESWTETSPLNASALTILAEILAEQGDLKQAYEHLCKSLEILDAIATRAGTDADRREVRESFVASYRAMVSVCLARANRAQKKNKEQAEAFRWEAWQWVQRSKARTMQESMAAFDDELQKHNQTVPQEFLDLIREQSELDRHNPKDSSTRSGVDDPMLTSDVQERIGRFLAQLISQGEQQARQLEITSKEAQAMALPRLARRDRPMVVVEFFTADAGRIGGFVHLAGQTTGLQEPCWLDGGQRASAQLANDCAAATNLLRKTRRYRTRDRSLSTEEPTVNELATARCQLAKVSSGLGRLLTPVRELIQQQGWQNATLLLCPSGALHLLPLAAAEWGTNMEGRAQCLIQAHALIHLPTAALANQIIERHHRDSDAPRRAYIAAADPWNKLSAIYHETNDARAQLQKSGFTVEHLQKEAATAQSLYKHGRQADVVHLAMHSHMEERHFELCGAEFHDRRFTTLELLRWLRFKQAQLAIIATCSSGQAIDLNADDPSAITRAWMLAGTPSVIGGLWPLADQPAAMFSGEFYEQWTSGESLAEAVRRAIIHVRKQDPDDIFAWAPYILVGNGATVI